MYLCALPRVPGRVAGRTARCYIATLHAEIGETGAEMDGDGEDTRRPKTATYGSTTSRRRARRHPPGQGRGPPARAAARVWTRSPRCERGTVGRRRRQRWLRRLPRTPNFGGWSNRRPPQGRSAPRAPLTPCVLGLPMRGRRLRVGQPDRPQRKHSSTRDNGGGGGGGGWGHFGRPRWCRQRR